MVQPRHFWAPAPLTASRPHARWRRALLGAASAAVALTQLPAAPAAAVEIQPAAPVVQKVEPQVVLRPASSRGARGTAKRRSVDAKGRNLVEISTTGSHNVPTTAMRAYRRAAEAMRKTRPACGITWTLLAAIGRVESDHGRYGGSKLGVDGLPRPAIRGVALNGVGPVAAIRDSDNGRWDDDKVWDRAVGPMQFIPTTWVSSGRDGDGDGRKNPNDIDDAALAAAAYLCPSSGSIRSEAAMRAAIFSYNHSDYYVDLVMAFERGYRTGVFVLPSPPVEEPKDKKKKKKKGKKGQDRKKGQGTKPAPKPAKPAPKPSKPAPKPPQQPKPAPKPEKPAPKPPQQEPVKPAPKPDKPSPEPEETPGPGQTSPSPAPTGGRGATPSPAPSSTPSPTTTEAAPQG